MLVGFNLKSAGYNSFQPNIKHPQIKKKQKLIYLILDSERSTFTYPINFINST